MLPRLIVIQASHMNQDPNIEAGQWALHHAPATTPGSPLDTSANRTALGPRVRLCILARRMVAREIFPANEHGTITSFEPDSDEFRRIQRRSYERQGEGESYCTAGPELLIHIHSPNLGKGLATYYASSRTAFQALESSRAYSPNSIGRTPSVCQLTLRHMQARHFQWYWPVWRSTTTEWRGALKHADAMLEFLQVGRFAEAAA